jgi:hypothetical protein
MRVVGFLTRIGYQNLWRATEKIGQGRLYDRLFSY